MRLRSGLIVAGLVGAGAWWARTHPSACPYALRFFVEGPHPGIECEKLIAILAPRPGEQVLEVGPGTGYYSLDVAARLGDGSLGVFDVQQEMLDHTMRAAAERGVSNIEPTRGDARALPYENASFDGAFLVTVLGEVPDQDAALRELARVLRPGGRLVVGELFGDPHMVGEKALRRRAATTGWRFERRVGPRFGFFARLT